MNIKRIIREVINEIEQQKLTVDYFKQRIPFLRRNWHEVDYDKGDYDKIVQIFTDQVNHPDAKIIHPDKGITHFKYFKTGVNFEYTRGKVSGNDNVAHNFKMTPIAMFELDGDDQLFNKVMEHATRMQLQKIGVNETIELPNGVDISDTELDQLINEMNKTFFTFEKFLSNFGIELNP